MTKSQELDDAECAVAKLSRDALLWIEGRDAIEGDAPAFSLAIADGIERIEATASHLQAVSDAGAVFQLLVACSDVDALAMETMTPDQAHQVARLRRLLSSAAHQLGPLVAPSLAGRYLAGC